MHQEGFYIVQNDTGQQVNIRQRTSGTPQELGCIQQMFLTEVKVLSMQMVKVQVVQV